MELSPPQDFAEQPAGATPGHDGVESDLWPRPAGMRGGIEEQALPGSTIVGEDVREEEYGVEFEDALAAPESSHLDPFYFVRASTSGKGDLWYASRTGDLNRVTHLVEHEGVDVNQRDRWDCVPLYLACLAGHFDVAKYLLDAGAVCNEYTFDGDRCHYVALTQSIRHLLSQYEQRPPPLPPLASSLRSLSTLCEDPEAHGSAPLLAGQWADFAFVMNGVRIPLHRALLSARSPFFRDMLCTLWQPQAGGIREVNLQHKLHRMSPNALRALLVWMYTERLDVGMSEVDAVRRVAKLCKLKSLSAALDNEQRTYKYYFKTLRKEEAPRRFVLQPSALPPEARLAADLRRLWHRSERLARSRHACSSAEEDFADVALSAGDRTFRCHRCILAARSDYFQALFRRSDHFGTPCDAAGSVSSSATAHPQLTRGDLCSSSGEEERLPQVQVADVTPEVLAVLLPFIYTGEVGKLPRNLLSAEAVGELFDAADRFLVFLLKREVAESLITRFERQPQLQGGLEGICRLLLEADRFQVVLLRDHCLHRLAARFDSLVADAPEQERAIFDAFLAAVAPKDSTDLLDGSNIPGASKGKIEGSGLGGSGVGTLLQDLREAYLEDFGGLGTQRDQCASSFDCRLHAIALRALSAVHSSCETIQDAQEE